MKKTLFALLLAATALSACNTMSGAGQDIKGGGQAITNTSDDVHRKIDGQ